MAKGPPPPRPAPLEPEGNGQPEHIPWPTRALLVGMLAVVVISSGVMLWVHAVRAALGCS